ncbi:MAG TPA: hypothetical protein VMW20_07480 [Candidatus Nanoarchaeia archaeon]|nr:hypothetical protein [Candidatus Nanoarchaeia archaeon]
MLRDEVGADALPMRFVVAALLMGILIALSATALADFTRDSQITRFSGDLAALEDRSAMIFQQGGARNITDHGDNMGTLETVTFTVPNGIEILVLGAIPSQNNGVHTAPYEQNLIYYTTYNGVTTTLTSGAKYASSPDLDGPIILTSGTYELTIELVKHSEGTFITLY